MWGWLDDTELIISQTVNKTEQFSVINDKGEILPHHKLATKLNNFWHTKMLMSDKDSSLDLHLAPSYLADFNHAFDQAVVPVDATIYYDKKDNPFHVEDVFIGNLQSIGQDKTLRIRDAVPWWASYYLNLDLNLRAGWSKQDNLVVIGASDGSSCGYGVYIFDRLGNQKLHFPSECSNDTIDYPTHFSFSKDDKWLAYWQVSNYLSNGKVPKSYLNVIDLLTGKNSTIYKVDGIGHGIAWSANNLLVFSDEKNDDRDLKVHILKTDDWNKFYSEFSMIGSEKEDVIGGILSDN